MTAKDKDKDNEVKKGKGKAKAKGKGGAAEGVIWDGFLDYLVICV